MNNTPHKRNPFAYHAIAGKIPAGKPADREVVLESAVALAALQHDTGQVIQHPPTMLTGLYDGMASQLRKKVWNSNRIKTKPAPRPAESVRNRQVTELLKRFDGLFRFWGIRYPLGLAKGRHLWSDDIANSARMAFYKAFLPHCKGGYADCHSRETTAYKVLRTPSGRIRRKQQPVYSNRQIVGHRLKPVYRIRKRFAPSCEKAAIYALKAAKYEAMRAGRRFTRHGLKETTFSSLDLKPGQSVADCLDNIGANPVDFAHEIGINSPWMDHTLQNLSECLSVGKDRISISHGAIKSAVAKCEAINGRVNKALTIADSRGLIGPLFLRMAGLQWREVAIVEGIKLPALKVKLHRMRAEISRINPAS